MQLPILIEPLVVRPGFSASLGSPFDLSMEADTAEAAVEQLTQAVKARLRSGAMVGSISLPTVPPGGWLPDDEVTREWLQAIQDYRDQCDKEDRERFSDDPDGGKVVS
jgi:hypothetical protein